MSPLLSLSLLFFVYCGLGAQESQQNERIINGVPAGPTEFPFQVSLQHYMFNWGQNSEGFAHTCGATIISKHYALTAAHCLYCRRSKDVLNRALCDLRELRLLAGSITLDPISDVNRYYYVESYKLYPFYDLYRRREDDVAIIRVKTPFDLSSSSPLKAVRIEKRPYDLLVNRSATIVGWGRTEIDNTSQRLRKQDVPVLPHEVCERAVVYDQKYIREKMICAKDRNSSACHGDSGGPMIQNGTQIGIASFVTAKGCPVNQPFVYVRVGTYYGWIRINTNFEV